MSTTSLSQRHRRAIARATRLAAWTVSLAGVTGLAGSRALRAEVALAQVAQPRAALDCRTAIEAARSNPTRAAVASASRCADRQDSIRRATSIAWIQGEIQRLSLIPWQIPEYHDEQRLPAGGDLLGPVAFIYASPHLAEFRRLEQFEEHGKRGLLAALVVVVAPRDSALPLTYRRLHLRPGVNCVWLAYGSTGAWRARVSNVAVGQPCTPDSTDSKDSPYLEVHRTKHQTAAGDAPLADYPPVARFGEALDGQPLLGVQCLDGWCEIGPLNFEDRPLANHVGSREGQIRGWHDEQRLAVLGKDLLGRNVLRASIRASIVPVPGIDAFSVGQFENGWIHVATIVVSDSVPPNSKYDRWGLRQGRNELYFQKVKGDTVWHAALQPPGAGPTSRVGWRFVRRHPHFDAAVPGTARFRWTVLDEGVWVPCGQGCCQAAGLAF